MFTTICIGFLTIITFVFVAWLVTATYEAIDTTFPDLLGSLFGLVGASAIAVFVLGMFFFGVYELGAFVQFLFA